MQDPKPARAASEDTSGFPEPAARRCPSCGTALDQTGIGGDELLECPRCGLVMFDTPRR